MTTELSSSLLSRYRECRRRTERLCRPLANEDFGVQSAPEVSPPKWHLAHTTWFFEEFLLHPHSPTYRRFDERFARLFNSYYKGLGAHWLQAERGMLSRPTVENVFAYRAHVDAQAERILERGDGNLELRFIVQLGIQHEEQHQELLLMDVKHLLATNPLETRYAPTELPPATAGARGWRHFAEGVVEAGHAGAGFAFDNEKPRHRNYVYGCDLSTRLVTNGEYAEFVEAGGYTRAEHWLSLGWEWARRTPRPQPLYWRRNDGGWQEYTLHGMRPLDPEAPLVHVNYFEADAYARWRGLRLPTEFEMERFLEAETAPAANDFFHPHDAAAAGQVWCWTRSAYAAYPGFRAFAGKAQEYNGKFMCNQFVLRGGCVATPPGHSRSTYRNFYLPEQQWMFAGVRLARDTA